MYDKTLVIEALRDAEDVLMLILDRTGEVETVDDFVLTPQGVDLLDATTIRLMAVGESVRKIEKRTEGTLLTQYPNIEWQKNHRHAKSHCTRLSQSRCKSGF